MAIVGWQGIERGLDEMFLPFSFAPSCGSSVSAAVGPYVSLLGVGGLCNCLRAWEARFSSRGKELRCSFSVVTRVSLRLCYCGWSLIVLGPICRCGSVFCFGYSRSYSAPAVAVAARGHALLFCSALLFCLASPVSLFRTPAPPRSHPLVVAVDPHCSGFCLLAPSSPCFLMAPRADASAFG